MKTHQNQNKIKSLVDALRLIPVFTAFFNFLEIILNFMKIPTGAVLTYIGYPSLAMLIFFLICSKVFNFCYYHRISIYYLIAIGLLSAVDQFFGLPISITALFIIHVIMFIILVLQLAYFKFVRPYCRIKNNID